jgi:hypothetical protein
VFIAILSCRLTHDAPSLVTYSCEDRDSFCYRNCLVHLGALGPVAHMRLRLVPDYRMQVYAFRGKCLPYILQNFVELSSSCHSFTLGLNFGTGECTTWLRHKLPCAHDCDPHDAPAPAPPADDALGSALMEKVPFHELGPDVPGGWLTSNLPLYFVLIAPHALSYITVKTTRIDKWHDALTWFMDR